MPTMEIFERDSVLLTLELRLLSIIILLYGLSCATHILQIIVSMFRRHFVVGNIATHILYAAAAAHTALIVIRGIAEGKPPFQSKYECLSWFAWTNVLTYIYVQKKWPRVHFPGIFVSMLSIAALFIATNKYDPVVTPVSPALQSDWYEWHVIIAFLSYAVFVVSCSMELSYLFIRLFNLIENSVIIGINKGFNTQIRKRDYLDYGIPAEALNSFRQMSFKLVLAGFPLLTFGIVSGAAWADNAWGRYWSWDPFEILSLITWTAFAMYLHAMSLPSWRRVGGSVFNVLGFFCMLLTFMGSGWLTRLFGLYSMHAY